MPSRVALAPRRAARTAKLSTPPSAGLSEILADETRLSETLHPRNVSECNLLRRQRMRNAIFSQFVERVVLFSRQILFLLSNRDVHKKY